METNERALTEGQRNKLNGVKAPIGTTDIRSFDRALWIMQETGYFDDANNGRFTVHYSPSSTEIRYINTICRLINFNRNGNTD